MLGAHNTESDGCDYPCLVRSLQIWFLDSKHEQTQYREQVESPRYHREEIDQSWIISVTRKSSEQVTRPRTSESTAENDEECSKTSLERHGVIRRPTTMM